MTTAFVSTVSTAAQAWNIMRDDVTLRQSLVDKVFRDQLQRDLRALNFEDQRSGNVGYYFPARIEVEIRHTDEYAQALYGACCEVWDIHELPKTRVFYRAVFECCLEPLFGTRRTTIQAELRLRDVRLNTPGKSSTAQGSLARRMDQLRSEWNRRLEKETRDSEIRERVRRPRDLAEAQAKVEALKAGTTDEDHAPADATGRDRKAWERAMADPRLYPTLSTAQVAYGLHRHKSTIYRLITEGKLTKASSGITVDSVLAYMKPEQ
jgi:hypothetical protein